MARQCYNTRLQVKAQFDPFSMGLDMRDELFEEHGKLLDDLLKIPLSKGDPSRMIRIGSDLDKETKEWLTAFL